MQMITLQDVYDAFLSKVNDDDWSSAYNEEDIMYFLKDWRSILNSALPYFNFPKCSLEIDEKNQCFVDNKMTQREVQILAVYMKQEWLKRTIDSWENIKTQYEEKDFSQANLLKVFISLREQAKEEALILERKYYRSINNRPFKYSDMAGGGSHVRGRVPRKL